MEFSKYKTLIKGILATEDLSVYRNADDVFQLLLGMESELGMDDPEVYKIVISVSKYVKNYISGIIARTGSAKFDSLYWDILLFEARNKQVDSGLLYLERNRKDSDKFYEPRREVFQKFGIIEAFQGLLDDRLDLVSISLPPGTGKLLSDDTPVLTLNGWKNHGDLCVGDYVYGLDGQPKRVLHVFPKDYADCLVTFSNGEQIQCHENHEWLIHDLSGSCSILETKTIEIIERPLFVKKDDSFLRIVSVKRVSPKIGNCIQVEDGMYCAGRTMVPTHNSTLEIFFLALVGGWFPNDFNLSSAHSSILTRSLYDGINEILNDPYEYTWHEIFPGIKLQGTNAKETTINLERAGRFKTWTFRSIDGSLTGATRCNRFETADDLVSGIEEALNNTRLENLWVKVVNDLRSRRLDGCKELFLATRWSTRDPIGKLKTRFEGSDRAQFIAVPALDESGESNFTYKYNGFSTEYFLEQKELMDEISFKCLYQQQPIEREGLQFPPDALRRFYTDERQVPSTQKVFSVFPDSEPDAIWAVCDTKDKGADFESLPIAYQFGEDYYILDVVFDDTTDYATLDQKTADILIKHNPHRARFESNQAGGRIADNIEKMIKGLCRTNIETRYTTANKETKILANSAWIIKHCLFLESTLYTTQSDYGKFMANLSSYSTRAKVVHDDAPDSMAMLAEYVQGRREAPPTRIIKSPF